MSKKIFFPFLLIISLSLKALPLDRIFKANDAESLRSYIKQRDHQIFLKILCEKQKENRKPPTACYELALPADSWCLSLKVGNLNLKLLDEVLQSSLLSSICREHLKEKQKILLYRKQDFFLPELKNYWTDQNLFF